MWQCPAAECLWSSVNPMEHPCPFPPLYNLRSPFDPALPGREEPRPDAPSRAVLDRVLAGLQQLDTSARDGGGFDV